jgi:histidinol-phosphate aminotransferase
MDQASLYPDPRRHDLVARLAEVNRIPEQSVVVGNGSDELVLLTALVLVGPGDVGITTGGTFPGYRICLMTAGRTSSVIPLTRGLVDVDAVLAALPGAQVAYLCNPHNPTGTAFTAGELERLVCEATRNGTLLIFDEAYMEFAGAGIPDAVTYLRDGANVLVLRTFSKAYGLAGLRIGYAMGRAETINRLLSAQAAVPFSVNRLAIAAAVGSLCDNDFLGEVKETNQTRRDWLWHELRRRGRHPLRSETNFLLVPVSDSGRVERELKQRFGVLVRDTGQFGYPGHIRVSLGSISELCIFLDALDMVEASGAGMGDKELFS